MSRDTWRDSEGFGRDVQVSPGTWSAIGPDDLDHSIYCEFITCKGVLPCDCDATRKRYGRDHEGKATEWYPRWLRWQRARSLNILRSSLVKWPVTGPDGEPWVPGVDFNDE